jgi:hypothetical protein
MHHGAPDLVTHFRTCVQENLIDDVRFPGCCPTTRHRCHRSDSVTPPSHQRGLSGNILDEAMRLNDGHMEGAVAHVVPDRAHASSPLGRVNRQSGPIPQLDTIRLLGSVLLVLSAVD